MDCKEVKSQLGVDSLSCIYPYAEDLPAFRVQKFVTYKNITIHCDFFERELGWTFYTYKHRFYVVKGQRILFKCFDGCGINEKQLVRILYKESKELMIWYIYSIFLNMLRKQRTAYAAYAAAYAAADAADAAAYAAADAAAYAAAAAAAAADAVDAAAYAAAAAAAAYAADADAVDAAAYAAAKKKSRLAFKKIIRFKKHCLRVAK